MTLAGFELVHYYYLLVNTQYPYRLIVTKCWLQLQPYRSFW